MDERDERLAKRPQDDRPRLRAVAYRMLGSLGEADDAVQEARLRLSRSNTADVENLGGWLTTVVARVCLNVPRSRASRRDEPLDARVPEPIVGLEEGIDPEHEALLADPVGLALLVVLDTLTPAERLAFVLHDIFAVPLDEISRSWAVPRLRRGNSPAAPGAARDGDFDALLAVLDPDVVLQAGYGAVPAGASKVVRGGACCGRAGARLLSVRPLRAAGARQRDRGGRHCPGRRADGGHGLHGRAREDRRDPHPLPTRSACAGST